MTTLGDRLAFLLTLDPDNAVRGLNKVEREADRSLGRTQDRLDRVGTSMTKIGAGMLSVGTLTGIGLAKAARATSDLNEAVNVTEVTFEDLADEAGEYGARAAAAIGQSERAAREALSTFGGLLQNLDFTNRQSLDWSKTLTTLSSDLASAFNTDPADAVQAIGSAIRGETEPIRRYNVMLDDASVRAQAVEMGLAETTAEVDRHGKAQAALALIMEQTSKVQGDFANTADGAANAQRTFDAQLENFQANIGQGVLPVLESMLGKGNQLLGAYNDLDAGTQQAIATAATYAAGLLIVGGGLSTVIGQTIRARNNIRSFATAVRNASAASLAQKGALVGVGLVLGKLWIDYQNAQNAAAEYRAEMEANLEMWENTRRQLSDTFEDGAISGATTEMFLDLVRGWDDGAQVLDALAASGVDITEMLRTHTDGVHDGFSAWESFTHQLVQADAITQQNARALVNLADQTLRATRETGDIDAAMENASDTVDETAGNVKNLERAWRDLVDELLGGQSAQTDAWLLVEDIAGAVDDLDGKTTAEVQQEVLDFVNELAGIKGAAAEAGEDIVGMSDTAELGLLALMDQAGLSNEFVQAVIGSLRELDGMEANANISIVQRGVAVGDADRALRNTPTVADLNSLTAAERDAFQRFTGGGDIHVHVDVDGDELATAVVRADDYAGGGFLGGSPTG